MLKIVNIPTESFKKVIMFQLHRLFFSILVLAALSMAIFLLLNLSKMFIFLKNMSITFNIRGDDTTTEDYADLHNGCTGPLINEHHTQHVLILGVHLPRV